MSHACQLITSQDPVTQHVAKLQIEKEQNQQRAKFKPMLTVQEVMVADPGASKIECCSGHSATQCEPVNMETK